MRRNGRERTGAELASVEKGLSTTTTRGNAGQCQGKGKGHDKDDPQCSQSSHYVPSRPDLDYCPVVSRQPNDQGGGEGFAMTQASRTLLAGSSKTVFQMRLIPVTYELALPLLL
jgi:hypothetical protein